MLFRSDDPWNITWHRTRGVKGRLEAAERGLISGNGPDGTSTSHGRGVVIYGLPGKLTPEALRPYLKDFKLVATEVGHKEIIKLESPCVLIRPDTGSTIDVQSWLPIDLQPGENHLEVAVLCPLGVRRRSTPSRP